MTPELKRYIVIDGIECEVVRSSELGSFMGYESDNIKSNDLMYESETENQTKIEKGYKIRSKKKAKKDLNPSDNVKLILLGGKHRDRMNENITLWKKCQNKTHNIKCECYVYINGKNYPYCNHKKDGCNMVVSKIPYKRIHKRQQAGYIDTAIISFYDAVQKSMHKLRSGKN